MRMQTGNKRQQSAIELLTTYSWAFLIIGLFLALVFVFSLSQPVTNYFPGSCSILPQLPCSQAFLSSAGPSSPVIQTVVFMNNLGTAIMFTANAFNASTTGISTQRVSGLGNCIPKLALPNDKVTCEAEIDGAQATPAGTYVDTNFYITYEFCNGDYIGTCINKIYKTSGSAAQTFGFEKSQTFILNFTTTNSIGFIDVNGIPYASNTAADVQAGDYTLYAAPPDGYVFSSWNVIPSNDILDSVLQNTILILPQNAMITNTLISVTFNALPG